MFRRSRYGNFLTILLIIAIIAIIAGVSILCVKLYKKHKLNAEAENAIVTIEKTERDPNRVDEDGNNINTIELEGEIESGTATGQGRAVKYYKDFVMIGYIEIPVIGLKYPILEQETTASLEVSVAVRYPNNAKLNEEDHIVIAGHNYRNGTLFSNLESLELGDKIKIKDLKGNTVVYSIYKKYETTPEDSTYITRKTGEEMEVTLVTCTDDSQARIIICAKEVKS